MAPRWLDDLLFLRWARACHITIPFNLGRHTVAPFRKELYQMTKKQLQQRQIKRVLNAIDWSASGELNKAFNKLKEVGWKLKSQTYTQLAGWENIWEHETVTQHNENAHIMSHYFCTLYSAEDEDAYCLVLGRIGNTRDWELYPPEELVSEEKQLLLDLKE